MSSNSGRAPAWEMASVVAMNVFGTVTRYAQRMLIENGIAEAIQFFHLDALSSLVGLKVDFDLQLTLMASWLYRLLAQKVGGTYAHAEAKTLYHHLLEVSATITVEDSRVVVQL